MSETLCANSFQACAIRVARLSATGTPVSGASQGYIAGAPVQVTLTPQYQKGVELTQENACGQLAGYYRQQDQLKSWDITFELTELDHELIEILTGVSLITSAGNSIGHQFTRVSSCSPIALNGVSLEFWSKRWDHCQQPSDGTLYWHWVFSRAYLHVGNLKLDNAFLTIPIEGYLEENANWGNGPWNDFPGGGTLASIGAVFQDAAALPTKSCGYSSVPLQT